MFADFAAAFHRFEVAREAELFRAGFAAQRRFTDEGEAGAAERASGGAELRAVERGLRRGDGRVGVAHVGPRDEAAFQNEFGFYAEERGFENDEVSEFADFERADDVRD